MGKCSSSSVICFENTTLFILIILIGIFIYYYHTHPYPMNPITKRGSKENNTIFNDPYVAPLKHYFPTRTIEMNMNTNYNKASFQQVGFLINHTKNDTPIALLGRPIQTNRDKWQYYCITDQYNSIKIPFLFKGKNSMNEYGCSELSNNDEVTLVGTKEKC